MINKLKSYNMTRNEFEKIFMLPLYEKFGHKSHWNSKELIHKGIKPITESDVAGTCYKTKSNNKHIVIKYKKNKTIDMLSTLIHEYTHAELHYYENKEDRVCSSLEEFEAEKVSFDVLKHFNINIDKTAEIKYYYDKSSKKDLEKYNSLNRSGLLKEFTEKIISAIGHNHEVLKSLSYISDHADLLYKYKVKCTCCESVWYYNRKTRMIKEKAVGYHCTICGKKSLNKLIVSIL